ncbi:Cytochrome P450 [Arabidopsis suecica]|uniref:Cytochrome P450 n=1 Tax=Arabidopsis suecica TaxID=45249 RepID=A0A8T1ZTB8_ARASU|nr:Cytochrome P450 [Arabidopsis suecica]
MYFKLNTIKVVLKALTLEEIETIRPCFGKLLDVYSKPVFSGKLAHFLLTRQLNVVSETNPNECGVKRAHTVGGDGLGAQRGRYDLLVGGKELVNSSKTFMVFGSGLRSCAGAEFARLQLSIFLHHLVANYDFSMAHDCEITRKPLVCCPNGVSISTSHILPPSDSEIVIHKPTEIISLDLST